MCFGLSRQPHRPYAGYIHLSLGVLISTRPSAGFSLPGLSPLDSRGFPTPRLAETLWTKFFVCSVDSQFCPPQRYTFTQQDHPLPPLFRLAVRTFFHCIAFYFFLYVVSIESICSKARVAFGVAVHTARGFKWHFRLSSLDGVAFLASPPSFVQTANLGRQKNFPDFGPFLAPSCCILPI